MLDMAAGNRLLLCMAKRSGAVHVATTTRKYGNKVYQTHLLRRSYREDGKVKHETLGNISHLPDEIIATIKLMLKGGEVMPVESAFEIERSLPHGHVAAVVGTIKKIGLDRLIASKDSRQRRLIIALIAARILAPKSKYASARWIESCSSLGECLDLGKISNDEIYEAMDWLAGSQDRIEKKLAKRHLDDQSLVMYDLTSTYFEGTHCPLAKRGYSRDRKKGKLQIEFGLLTDQDGRPIATQVFPGNAGDPSTVPHQVETLRKRFKLNEVVIVGDRGMITAARIREDLKPADLKWITSLRAPAIRALAEGNDLQLSLFDETDIAVISEHPDYPGERLIVCRNPFLQAERARKRSELLDATEAEFQKIADATQRLSRPLKGQDQIGERFGRVAQKYRMKKHFEIEIGEHSFVFSRREESIAREAELDGLYAIRTNVSNQRLSNQDAVQAYKNLSRVERAFRCFKTVDLRVRPIFHRLESRVRSHVFLCLLAYYVEWHMRKCLAPLLFDDEFPEFGQLKRESVVAPAQRSDHALEKTASKIAADGLEASSFRLLLERLATLTRNRIRVPATNARYTQLTNSTPLQKKAFELLGISTRL